jgi:hypothetical protein
MSFAQAASRLFLFLAFFHSDKSHSGVGTDAGVVNIDGAEPKFVKHLPLSFFFVVFDV